MKKLLCIILSIAMLTALSVVSFAEDKGIVSIYYDTNDAIDSVMYYNFKKPTTNNVFGFNIGITNIIRYDYVYIQIDHDKELFDFKYIRQPQTAGAIFTSGDTNTGIYIKSEFDDLFRDKPSYQDYSCSAMVSFDVKKTGKVDFKITAYGVDLNGNRVDLEVKFNNVITEIKAKYDAAECQKGDVNCDSTVTASDARSALRISAGLDTPADDIRALADFDSNGKVTAADARKILRIAAGLE